MATSTSPSKGLHIALWIVQLLLAAILIWAASLKLFQPVKVAAMWPWTVQVPAALLKFTGIVDLLGGFGLVLPMLLNIQPRLTFYAAWGIIILMIVASIFHISRGEAGNIAPNIVFAVMAGFVAWGGR